MHTPVSFHSFTIGVQTVAATARRLGLVVPYFRCPPRRAGTTRTIQPNPSGVPTVRIALRGRDSPEVFGDVVDAILLVNVVDANRVAGVRAQLLESVAVLGSYERTAA